MYIAEFPSLKNIMVMSGERKYTKYQPTSIIRVAHDHLNEKIDALFLTGLLVAGELEGSTVKTVITIFEFVLRVRGKS